uniref:Uncharacterized protein n=1 Tax=Ditylenchus dipsaci TaxID=166011 RepID=A0A915DPR5_9BILA
MYTTPIRNDYDDSRYRCCYNMHVEKAAYAIAFIGAVFSGIAASYYFLEGNTAYAQGKPTFYLPFLILNMLTLLSLIFLVVFLIAMFVIMPTAYKDGWAKVFHDEGIKFHSEQELLDRIRKTLGVTIAVTTIYTALVAYFYSIIYRAYKFMREQIAHGVPISKHKYIASKSIRRFNIAKTYLFI